MSKQINYPIVSNDTEVATPPLGYYAIYYKDVLGNPQAFIKDDAGAVSGIVSGVDSVNGLSGIVSLKNLDFTQWNRDVGSVVVGDGSNYNIFEGFIPGDKTSISAVGSGALDITSDVGEDFIQVNWQGTIEAFNIRIIMEVQQGGTDYYRLFLRRKADDSIISVHPFSINSTDQPEDIVTINISTFVGSALDSFVTGGFYVEFANNSGGSATIANDINVLIERRYQNSLTA